MFAGELDCNSSLRALQVNLGDRLTQVISMQRFGGREGSFVLHGSEAIEKGKIRSDWFVVPGFGTGQLTVLRGQL